MLPRLRCMQVTILGRHDQDELLLLASDGLWDVLSNQVRCNAVNAPLPFAQRLLQPVLTNSEAGAEARLRDV